MDFLLLYTVYLTENGCREAFARQLVHTGFITAVRGTEGCRRYDLYFSAQNENELLVMEEWADESSRLGFLGRPEASPLADMEKRYIHSKNTVPYREEQ